MSLFPKCFTQGVSVRVTATLSDYPASSWTLRLVFVQDDDQQIVDATADGDGYVIALAAAESAEFDVGTYDYQAFVTDGTDRYMVESGQTEVAPDFEQAAGGLDTRTQIQRTIQAIEAQMAGVATDKQKRAKYRDREIENFSSTELIEILSYLRLEERRQARRKGDNRVRVRFR